MKSKRLVEMAFGLALASIPQFAAAGPYDHVYGQADFDACVANPPAAPAPDGTDRTINFLAFGDSQIVATNPDYPVGTVYKDPEFDRNRLQVELMNKITSYSWPAEFIGPVKKIDRIRGVIVAGDLTQFGDHQFEGSMQAPLRQMGEWEAFLDLYGFCGDRKLKYTVYEGYGNHDFVMNAPPGHRPPVIDEIKRRNVQRARMGTIVHREGPHYSWDWGNLHFVQLNLEASNDPYTVVSKPHDPALTKKVHLDPMNALTFLKKDLSLYVGNSRKGVIIITHFPYPYLPGRKETKYTTVKELDDLHRVIKKYNTVAILHGHTHSGGKTYNFRGIPVFDLGTPFWTKTENNKIAHFTVFKISHKYLQAADVAWDVKRDPGKPREIKSVTVGKKIPGRSWGHRIVPINVPAW